MTAGNSVISAIKELRVATIIAIGVSAIHIAIALSHAGPVAVPDVSAYLYFQQLIFGGARLTDVPFFPGYGLMLVPFGPLAGQTLHTMALVTNGVFAGFIVVLAAVFVRRLGGSTKLASYGGVLAAVHPAVSNASRVAWPETVLAFILLAVAITLCSENPRQLALGGVFAGLSVALHPRMVVVAGSVVLLGVLCRSVRPVLLGVFPSLLVSAAIVVLTGAWPVARIDAGLTAPGLQSVMATVAGQFLSLIGSSAGFAGVGLAVGISILLCSLRLELGGPAATFLSVSSIGMLLLGGWVTAGSERNDTLLYGRYIDPWVVPLALLGIVALIQLRRHLPRLSILVVASSAAAAVILSFAHHVTIPGRRIMTSSLGIFWSWSDGQIRPALLWSLSAGVLGLLLMCIRRRDALFIAASLLLLIASASTVSNHRYLAEVGRVAEGQAESIASLPLDVSCLGHDTESTKSYALWLYRLRAPSVEHQRLKVADGELPCQGYVIAGDEVVNHCLGAVQIARESRAAWGLWRYPVAGCS